MGIAERKMITKGGGGQKSGLRGGEEKANKKVGGRGLFNQRRADKSFV